ncbi:MAG TPA: ABC transporter permease [Bryobacteraceae bacterium]|nr:ABC transporter permease [Bryobacteraceae bacterium]
MMEAIRRDVKQAARSFARAPGFTITAVGTLAIGIAANTAIFSVVNTVLLKPFAYRDPGRIVMLQNTLRDLRFGSAAPVEFNWWRRESQSFGDISAYDFDVANWTDESSAPEQIPVMHVSAEFFRLCGVQPVLGRTFTDEEDLPHAPKTVVLAYAFWQRRFGGDPRVLGRRITLNGEGYQIIGALGSDLEHAQITERSTLSGAIEIHEPPAIYLPFQLEPESTSHAHYFNVAARLKQGVTLAAANQRLRASYQGYARQWPDDDGPGRSFAVQLLQDAITQGVRGSLLILMAAVALVLLIACANVANLLLARATGRRREMVVRAALGAGRARIVRQLLAETLMLSLAGATLGLTAGYAAVRAMLTLVPGGIPRIGAAGANVALDWRILGFTVGLAMAAAVVSGLAPALQSSRADLSSALNESDHRGGTGLKHNRARSLLVIIQIALSVVLLMGAALLIRSFFATRRVNPGFDPSRVLTMRVSLAGPRFRDPAAVTRVTHEGLRRIRLLPGVEAAATTCCVPLEDRWQVGFQVAGQPASPSSQGIAGLTLVSAGYFESFKISILRGRSFTERDEGGPPVVIVNQALAKQFWPHGDPLHEQIVFGGEHTRSQIIGVAADVRDDFLNRAARPIIYQPSVSGIISQAWVIRTRVPPMSLSAAVQEQLRQATGGLPVAQIRTMEETLARSTAAESFDTLVLTNFACTALLLAAIGIYGLVAYSVAQRTREIGIRLALGAAARDIRALIIFEGVRPIAAGLACGLAAALAFTRFLTSLLFGVKPWDPLVFLCVPLLLSGVAVLATWFPARRAARLDPIRALRGE